LKEILKEGTGSKPVIGQKVECHYVGTLQDGTEFDSSRKNGKTFKFTVGEGVIEGFSETLKSMNRGELAKVTLQSHYAYGKEGVPPSIPENATLIFEIEYLSLLCSVSGCDNEASKKICSLCQKWNLNHDVVVCSQECWNKYYPVHQKMHIPEFSNFYYVTQKKDFTAGPAIVAMAYRYFKFQVSEVFDENDAINIIKNHKNPYLTIELANTLIEVMGDNYHVSYKTKEKIIQDVTVDLSFDKKVAKKVWNKKKKYATKFI